MINVYILLLITTGGLRISDLNCKTKYDNCMLSAPTTLIQNSSVQSVVSNATFT